MAEGDHAPRGASAPVARWGHSRMRHSGHRLGGRADAEMDWRKPADRGANQGKILVLPKVTSSPTASGSTASVATVPAPTVVQGPALRGDFGKTPLDQEVLRFVVGSHPEDWFAGTIAPFAVIEMLTAGRARFARFVDSTGVAHTVIKTEEGFAVRGASLWAEVSPLSGGLVIGLLDGGSTCADILEDGSICLPENTHVYSGCDTGPAQPNRALTRLMSYSALAQVGCVVREGRATYPWAHGAFAEAGYATGVADDAVALALCAHDPVFALPESIASLVEATSKPFFKLAWGRTDVPGCGLCGHPICGCDPLPGDEYGEDGLLDEALALMNGVMPETFTSVGEFLAAESPLDFRPEFQEISPVSRMLEERCVLAKGGPPAETRICAGLFQENICCADPEDVRRLLAPFPSHARLLGHKSFTATGCIDLGMLRWSASLIGVASVRDRARQSEILQLAKTLGLQIETTERHTRAGVTVRMTITWPSAEGTRTDTTEFTGHSKTIAHLAAAEHVRGFINRM